MVQSLYIDSGRYELNLIDYIEYLEDMYIHHLQLNEAVIKNLRGVDMDSGVLEDSLENDSGLNRINKEIRFAPHVLQKLQNLNK